MPARKPLPPVSCRILLVDDNHFGNVARKALLEEHGFTVECALSGEEAWALLQQSSYDLVITDLKMKKMNGVELIERLRKLEHPPRTILLSAMAVWLGIDEQSSGADAVLAKSNNEPDQLMSAVRQLLARRVRPKPPGSETQIRRPVARSG
jgi:CheY-like chemotaxis protein